MAPAPAAVSTQALIQGGTQVPGIGIKRIRQQLHRDETGAQVAACCRSLGSIDQPHLLQKQGVEHVTSHITGRRAAGAIVVNNEAEFQLGPLGSWRVAIDGLWQPPNGRGDVGLVKVCVCVR